MTTKVKPRQIKGLTLETLKHELDRFYKKVGYFLGAVAYEADLATLTPEVGNVAFVNENRKWVYWTGMEWIDISAGGSGGSSGTGTGGGDAILQITKLGLNGLSQTTPKVIDMIVPYVEGFKRAPIEVLKFKADEANIISTLIDFVNTDEDDFQDDAYVQFDGAMSLVTKYERAFTEQGALGEGTLHTIKVNIKEFVSMHNIKIREADK